MKRLIFPLFILAGLAGAGYAGFKVYQQLPKSEAAIPTQIVRRSDVIVRAFTRGELRPVRTASLVAPNLFGMVMINQLAQTGSFANPGALIAEFDDSELKTRLEEKQLEIDQFEEQIKKARADLEIRSNQDQVELLRARYGVRRAELEVQRNELLSSIDQKRNQLNLEEAKRRLSQLESDIQSRKQQAEAELAVLEERRRRGLLELDREQQRLLQVRLLAPMAGLVAVRQNRAVSFNFGQQLPDWREGDQVQPGMSIADILDLSEMEVSAKVNELDRANLREGQQVLLRPDALPGKSFDGTIKTMSATASSDVFSADPVKRFDVTFSVDMRRLLSALGAKDEVIEDLIRRAPKSVPTAAPAAKPNTAAGEGGQRARGEGRQRREGGERRSGPQTINIPGLGEVTPAFLAAAQLPPPPGQSGLDVLLRPGLLVDVEIILSRADKVLNIPAQSLFEKDGKQVVYVKQGSRFVARPVQLEARSESTIILKSGLQEGDVIALQDPNAESKPDAGKPTSGPALPVGGSR
jgi:multidrug resistance efflux pump